MYIVVKSCYSPRGSHSSVKYVSEDRDKAFAEFLSCVQDIPKVDKKSLTQEKNSTYFSHEDSYLSFVQITKENIT